MSKNTGELKREHEWNEKRRSETNNGGKYQMKNKKRNRRMRGKARNKNKWKETMMKEN